MAERENLPNPNPCTPGQENRNWQLTNLLFKQIIEDIEGGAVDDFTFKETDGGTAGFWDEKVNNESVYDGGVTHQLVSFQIEVDGTITLFTDTSAAGGDNYTVKIESAGTAGYLESKIHAATWEPTDTYASGTHFIILAANVSDAVRFYAPYNIIKNSSGDSSPNYLYNKFADGTATAYNASLHTPVYVNDLGGTLRLYTLDSDTQAVLDYKVKVDSADTTPDYLHNKIKDTSTYSSTNHQLVYSQAVDSGDKSVRLFTNKATTTSGALGRVIGSGSGDCSALYIIEQYLYPATVGGGEEMYTYANNFHEEFGVELPAGALVNLIGTVTWGEDNPPTCPGAPVDRGSYPTAMLGNFQDYAAGMEGYADSKVLYIDLGTFTYDIGWGGGVCE